MKPVFIKNTNQDLNSDKDSSLRCHLKKWQAVTNPVLDLLKNGPAM
jgi:hypothetical protein